MSPEETHQNLINTINEARSAIEALPEGKPRQNVHDALRIIAAGLSFKMVVRKTHPPLTEHPAVVIDRALAVVWDFVKVAMATSTDRRLWLVQGAVTLARENLFYLKEVKKNTK